MQMEDTREIVTFDLGTGACGVGIAVKVHRTNFFLAHSIVK